MGWFSSSPSPSLSTPKVSADGTPEAPNRSARSHCWEARDAYFQCLDRNSIIDSIKDSKLANERCGKEDEAFAKDCATSWIQYFKKRRVMEHQRNETLEKLSKEGAVGIPQEGASS
ncbi:MAG: hypothetical protein M1817_006669 [Caeruleum heppii]|nr:MAG: hypothetical protein M1817_006669 [Caeruleum heppii]